MLRDIFISCCKIKRHLVSFNGKMVCRYNWQNYLIPIVSHIFFWTVHHRVSLLFWAVSNQIERTMLFSFANLLSFSLVVFDFTPQHQLGFLGFASLIVRQLPEKWECFSISIKPSSLTIFHWCYIKCYPLTIWSIRYSLVGSLYCDTLP